MNWKTSLSFKTLDNLNNNKQIERKITLAGLSSRKKKFA